MKISACDFNLTATLESGQVFGFTSLIDGRYEGNLLGHPVALSHQNGFLHVRNGSSPLREETVRDYFDLDRKLEEVYAFLRQDDPLRPCYESFRGLRLIRQDAWEALACFILSSNNNVKRIMGIYRNLCSYFSERRKNESPGFPAPREIAGSHGRILRQLGLGYRAPFLMDSARFLASNPFYLEAVRQAEYEPALARVKAFPGIGPKVADCVLLYGFHKLEAFPVDVWIARAMRKLYFKGRSVDAGRIRRLARKKWGGLAGYVQQYLFHAARCGKI